MLSKFARPAAPSVVSLASTVREETSRSEAPHSEPVALTTERDDKSTLGRSQLTQQVEDAAAHEDTASGTQAPPPLFYAGLMLRGHKTDLARFFELPPSESLRGDFHCALRKKVLLQGRMYVFDHYVCFYSAVFGFAKKRRIPMRTIKVVKKKTHLGLPNSVEIDHEERKDFFTSFLSREEAYQLIQRLVPDAKRLAEQMAEEGRRLSHDVGLAGHSDLSSRMPAPEPSNGSSPAGPSITGPSAAGPSRMAVMSRGPPAAAAGAAGRSFLATERSGLSRHSGSGLDDNDDGEDEGSVWIVEPRPVPPLGPSSRHLMHVVMPGTPRALFDCVLADSAPFFEDFLDSQGNRRINLSTWKRDPQLGHVRDLQFTAPIKGAFGNWGVSHTACYQSHRFCVYAEDHLVFESSQTMTDIPYGDCFTVDLRWDVKRDHTAPPDRPQILFDVHVRVPFTGRCLFKGVIESGTFKQVQETYTHLVEQLRPVMEDFMASRQTLTLRPEGPVDELPTPGRLAGSLATTSRPLPRAQPPALGAAASLRQSASFTLRRSAAVAAGAFDAAGDGPLAEVGSAGLANGLDSAAHGGRQHASVGRLLLALGGRLVEGARGVLDSGVDVILNLAQCQTTPQMRLLIGLVLLMFLANCVCMVGFLWWPPAAQPGGAPGEAGAWGGGVDVGGGVQLRSDGAGAPGAGSMGLSGGGVGYWAQRMAVLQQELQLLQGRLEVVSREVGVVMTHLSSAAAAAARDAGGMGGGEGGAASPQAAGEL